jgi:hypothetical protein
MTARRRYPCRYVVQALLMSHVGSVWRVTFSTANSLLSIPIRIHILDCQSRSCLVAVAAVEYSKGACCLLYSTDLFLPTVCEYCFSPPPKSCTVQCSRLKTQTSQILNPHLHIMAPYDLKLARPRNRHFDWRWLIYRVGHGRSIGHSYINKLC